MSILVFILFGIYIYIHYTQWRIFNFEEGFERVDSIDKYDKWFQRSEGERLFSDDFVIYVHGSVNDLEIVTTYVNLRVSNKDGDKIERMKRGIEKVLERYEPVKLFSSS